MDSCREAERHRQTRNLRALVSFYLDETRRRGTAVLGARGTAGMGLCCGASQARRDRSADYEERRKQELLGALGEGYKTVASQTTYADSSDKMFIARVERGKAKAAIAAAKANLLAAEVEFKVWQTQMATMRQEKRIYGS